LETEDIRKRRERVKENERAELAAITIQPSLAERTTRLKPWRGLAGSNRCDSPLRSDINWLYFAGPKWIIRGDRRIKEQSCIVRIAV
jgi:hypothetical protein